MALKTDLRFESLEFLKFGIFQKVIVEPGSSQGEPGSHKVQKHAPWKNVWGTRILQAGTRFPAEKSVFFEKNELGTRFLPRRTRFPATQNVPFLVFILGTRFLPHENRFLRPTEPKLCSFDSIMHTHSLPINPTRIQHSNPI